MRTHRNKLTLRQIRKLNAFLDKCARMCNSEDHRALILAHKIHGAKIGQTVTKGT